MCMAHASLELVGRSCSHTMGCFASFATWLTDTAPTSCTRPSISRSARDLVSAAVSSEDLALGWLTAHPGSAGLGGGGQSKEPK